MRCPYCHFKDSKVIDSRDTPDNDGIRRRRECLKCSLRFTTYERVQPVSISIIKKDGRREEYSREKLLEKIRIACSKRPIPTGAINQVVDEIEVELFRTGESEIPSRAIGELVLNKLRTLDHVAYIRFASVYRDFHDIESLRAEVEQLQGARAASSGSNGSASSEEGRRPASTRRTTIKRGKR